MSDGVGTGSLVNSSDVHEKYYIIKKKNWTQYQGLIMKMTAVYFWFYVNIVKLCSGRFTSDYKRKIEWC